MQKNWTEIVLLCQQGNRTGQKLLFKELWPYLNAICKRYINQPEDIKDILQESFMRIFKAINQYDSSKSHIKTWASRITINCCLQHNSKNRISILNDELNELHVVENPCVFEKASDNEILQALKQMPESFYQIFNLSVIDGYSHKEIAEQLKISEALSRQRLKRAKDWVKKNLSYNWSLGVVKFKNVS